VLQSTRHASVGFVEIQGDGGAHDRVKGGPVTPVDGHPRQVLAMLATLCIAATARAGDPPRPIAPETLAGAASFEWARGRACTPVDSALIKKWAKGYTCVPPDEGTGSASGRPVKAECKAKRSRSAYLVFANLADCKEERETQLANE
jgi:hypothetical protein